MLFISKGADVGVTVSPIRINSLKDFGSLETVGERLLGTEKAKVSPSFRKVATLYACVAMLEFWRRVLT